MTDVAITVQHVGKRFELGELGTMSDLVRKTRRLGSRLVRSSRRGRDHTGGKPWEHDDSNAFWALKDINFEVKEGEVLGIIGGNGAGKSTLLKVLSRITAPTTGRIELYGRVASLLEVGTGFHPELTGRENVFLNGSILGMSRTEIKSKFDEIVAFSGVEKFIDTPVKRYSSGMKVRLGFAVAAHLEPEILVIDEVLAVGDVQFQRRCLGKMKEVAGSGRTVLFVSHNMPSVRNLCGRGILLTDGEITIDGTANEAVDGYLKGTTAQLDGTGCQDAVIDAHLDKELPFHVTGVTVTHAELGPGHAIATGAPVEVRLDYEAASRFHSPAFIISIASADEVELIRLSNLPISGFEIEHIEGRATVVLRLEHLPLTSGRYFISLGVARPGMEMYDRLNKVFILDVEADDVYGSGAMLDNNRGLFTIDHTWSMAEKSATLARTIG